MMRKFKHKQLWWVATETEHEMGNYYWVFKIWKKIGTPIFKELIEADSNREEVVENDWIDKVLWEMFDMNNESMNLTEKEIRELIEENCPVQKKFTEKEVEEYYWEWARRQTIDIVCSFLQDQWLLEE